MPLISILIVNYNGKAHLEECLASIEAQTFKDHETILVDNASKDGSVDFIRARFPWVKVVESGANLGFSGGNNLGMASCAGEWVFLLNNDTRMDPGTLAELAAAAAGNPGVGVFASFLINYRDHGLSDSGGDTVYTNGAVSALGGYPVGNFTKARPIASACAAAAMYRSSLLKTLGGFDDDFFLNYEDMDLSFRSRHLGETVLFLPQSRVYHKGSASLGGKRSSLSLYYSERNYPWFLVKNFPLPTLLRILPSALAFKALRFLRTLFQGHSGTFLRANWHSLRGIPRMWRKRGRILGASKLSRKEFEAMLRPHWFRERLDLKRGRGNLDL